MSAVQEIEVQNTPGVAAPVKRRTSEQFMLGVLAAFAVTWGLLSLAAFTLTEIATTEQLMKAYSMEQVVYIQNTPAWVSFAKAMTAIATLCGAVYLLLRKKSAYHWFSIALVGTLLVMLDSGLRGGFHILGGMETGVNLGMVIVSIFLFWAAYIAYYRGHLED